MWDAQGFDVSPVKSEAQEAVVPTPTVKRGKWEKVEEEAIFEFEFPTGGRG